MSTATILPDVGFSREQKEYLQGYFAGLACRGMIPFVGHLPNGRITNVPEPGLVNRAAEPEALAEETVGVFKQAQPGLNYIGAVITVGRIKSKQMRRIADVAQNYGSGEIRLTVWQNLLIPNVPDHFVETVKKNLVKMGFHHSATSISGGLIACTGNTGCKWAATNTKGHAVLLARHLEKKLQLDQPINIHLTGCPNSCAQHYIGDIGLLGAKVDQGGDTVEGYHVVLGGGFGEKQAVAREVFRGVPFNQLPTLLEHVLKVYLAKRNRGESFADFTRRHGVKELQELFSE